MLRVCAVLRSSFDDSVRLRARIALEDLLIAQFSQPRATLERKIIQSAAFRRDVLSKWANYCVRQKRVFSGDQVKQLLTLRPIKTSDPEISWLLSRIASPSALNDAATTSFPSTLARTGPRFPFTPQEFDHLSRKFGSLTGEELARPISVSRVARRVRRADDLGKFAWSLADDEDRFEEDLLNPKSVSLFPSF